ncbi:VOC family protein [Streptomyces sp. NPDC012389]|uniref:VOC family protein n=1 Tax=unclassified Streptomyces TaxID=2593676 RepID=UPI00081DC8C5|nr:VOC family protein [Streptomyces sp. ScaeMP-e83]MYR95502.1 bleomycin resistance protein [Streptomyces sp. SID4937]MYX14323.1 bleomycin resistance protein [Streptomyces sp. SID8374]SCD91802.1 methylmalonyl-CoA/ethylmalonyl-CoA epimerase [Streptomyces sp. ScaeMP-e83]
MILGIDHIGLATAEPDRTGAQLSALGLHRTDEGTADAYRVACSFWSLPGDPAGAAVELVSPTGPGSAVEGRLRGPGPGFYHLALTVDDLAEETARLRASGFLVLDAEPCRGARPGMRVVFVYAPEPADLLVELVHYAPAPAR